MEFRDKVIKKVGWNWEQRASELWEQMSEFLEQCVKEVVWRDERSYVSILFPQRDIVVEHRATGNCIGEEDRIYEV